MTFGCFNRLVESEGWFIAHGKPEANFGYFGCSVHDAATDITSSARVLEHIKARAAEGSVLHIEALMMIQLQ